MSQYGAKARAESGQSVEEILKAYYPNATLKKDYPVMGSITVDGVGTILFEDQYLQGIYEMPASWSINALKAQAIAARTYAVKYTDNGSRSICTTESCQVFKNSKKGGDWEKAVNETKGWVLVDGGGNPVSTQYASTHGGYANTSGWDTTDKSNSGDWSTRAWENKAGSPWFYKAWYRSGYSASGANCGRAHPWLSQEEFSDIINAWIVRKNPNGADVGRIQPVTINQCQIGGQGGDPYSISELRSKADNSGGAVTNVSSVSVSHNNNGQTVNVHLETNRGSLDIPGSEFKEAFNLRAPGYLRIPQSRFAFFNIEHKN
ncbi:MAG: SpoIID/LytB domain-containing protein [Candidatus Pacebacteria bacterium]|nr:SpoIID/LytB domain-containing protein [Candidatus Paceibacterota bacterium]